MLNKILYADSGADNAQDMLKTLLELPALQGSEVSILRVISPKTKEQEENAAVQAQEKIDDLIHKLNINNGKVISQVSEGDPKTTVLKVAQEQNSDLIIMGLCVCI